MLNPNDGEQGFSPAERSRQQDPALRRKRMALRLARLVGLGNFQRDRIARVEALRIVGEFEAFADSLLVGELPVELANDDVVKAIDDFLIRERIASFMKSNTDPITHLLDGIDIVRDYPKELDAADLAGFTNQCRRMEAGFRRHLLGQSDLQDH
jgi:hypothetical protein